jgi:hypothetical protein
MALFFLLSDYFSPIAARKHIRLALMKQKLKRLDVPTVTYSLQSKGIIKAIVGWQKDKAKKWFHNRGEEYTRRSRICVGYRITSHFRHELYS